MTPYKIGVIGLWHLGETYSVGLSKLGHRVIGISEDEKLIENFNNCIPPLPEPNLGEFLKEGLFSGNLTYTTNFETLRECDVLWITFDTPVDDNDEVDLGVIWKSLESVVPHLKNGVVIVVTSQIPAGTSRKIREFIQNRRPELKFEYAYAPENLRLSEAMKCFLEPSRIVIGADSDNVRETMKEIFGSIKTEFLFMSTESAEMAKHALNAFLATSVSFINDIADICEQTGADILDVVRSLKTDPRIGPKAFLDAGLGFSGGTLGRDLKALVKLGKEYGRPTPVIEAIIEKNISRGNLVEERLMEILGDFKGKKIAIFGLTYKAGTRTLRRSRALEVAKSISDKGASLMLYDPYVIEGELPRIANAVFLKDPYEAAKDSDAIVVVTPWPEFKTLDFLKLSEVSKKSAMFFDTSNFLKELSDAIKKAGFRYKGIGR